MFLFGPRKQSVARNEPVAISAIRFQTSVYGLVIPIVYGTARIPGNVIWYGDFVAIPHTTGGGGGGGGKGFGAGAGAGSSVTSYTYQAAMEIALCEGPIDGINQVWQDKNLTNLAALGLTLFTGAYPQAAWGYLTTHHPGEDLQYNGLAYVAGSGYQLTDSAALPNHTFEVQGRFRYNPGGGILDANPKDVIVDFLTNTNYGALFPSANLDSSLTQYSAYCVANSLFVSLVADSQQPAREYLQELIAATNSEFVWSGGVLTAVPYGDTAATGNSVTFTPDLTPQYDLTDVDFISASNDDPVVLVRTSPADALNQFQLEFMNRANQYNAEPVEAKDQAAIDQYTVRASGLVRAHEFALKDAAQLSAQLMLQRSLYVRNTYQFKVGWKYCRLDPMDLVTLTDSTLGLDRQLVRIKTIEEDEDGVLSMTAEQMDVGVAAAPVYPYQAAVGFGGNYNEAPGDVNTPIFLEPPVEIHHDLGLEVWAGVSGGPTWGGCEVWVSSDDATYQRAGKISGESRMGVLLADLPVGVDPDISHELRVDVSESAAELLAGTQADADAFHTLCLVGDELVSYKNADLIGANQYVLTYLRRGVYGTTIAAHTTGSQFLRLDDAVFRIPYSKDQIGKQLYVKFLSFNQYGFNTQQLSDVSPYTYTIVGPPNPPNVVTFSGQQTGNVVVFKWSKVEDYVLKGYDIRYSVQGSSNWDSMTPLTEVSAGTEMTNASVPPGDWTFAIRARDLADQLSPVMTTFNLTVVNNNSLIVNINLAEQAPDWLGTIEYFEKHWSGVLVPASTKDASQMTNAELFEQFVPYPKPGPNTYEAPEIDLGFDATVRLSATILGALGRGASGSFAPTLELDYRTNAGAYQGFQPWTIGSVTARFIKMRLIQDPSIGKGYISGFRPTADAEPKTQAYPNFAVGSGGTPLVFNEKFFSAPSVQVTPVGTTPSFGAADTITTNGANIHLWNTSGTGIAGTVNIDVKGV